MNVGILTVGTQILFWEYLFRIFGIASCSAYTRPGGYNQRALGCYLLVNHRISK
jgi:hypothetical protein